MWNRAKTNLKSGILQIGRSAAQNMYKYGIMDHISDNIQPILDWCLIVCNLIYILMNK